MGAELCLAHDMGGVEAYGGPLSVDMQPYGCSRATRGMSQGASIPPDQQRRSHFHAKVKVDC